MIEPTHTCKRVWNSLFKKEARQSLKLKHNSTTRVRRRPCRTSGTDSQAPIGTAWCVAAVCA